MLMASPTDYFPEDIDNIDQILLSSSLFINAIIELSSPPFMDQLSFSNLLSLPITKKLDDPTIKIMMLVEKRPDNS
jgi:hypothetical protein